MFTYLLLGIVWFLIAFGPAFIARSKGYSFLLYWLISIPFWWITFFVVMFLKDKNRPSAPTTPATPAE